ncbi:alpha-ketoacid dehydrogenase subunit beta [Candidatus Micrarchaeota archaeon]|nr:alpha-ketoacid dehydrogenase subunit beta [Candidatus Micrarchaeota archaeon]
MSEKTLIAAINEAMCQEMERDPTVLVMGEDVGLDGGVFRATDGLQGKFGTNRSIDTPLAESAIVGTAIGMAAGGLRPVAEIQFAGFILPGFNQLINHAARLRMRSQGQFTCPLVVRAPCSGGIRALEHHSESPEALYAHVPGLKVVVPSTPFDAKGLLVQSIREPDPVIFLEPSKYYRAFKQDVPDELYAIPLGQGEVRIEGTDLTLVTWGSMVRPAMQAAADSGKSVEVIDLRSISPWDKEMVLNSVRKTGRLVIAHEAPLSGGFGAEIAATVAQEAMYDLKGPILRVGAYDVPFPLARREDFYIPSPQRIGKAIQTACEG